MQRKTILFVLSSLLGPIVILAILELVLTLAGSGASSAVVRPCNVDGTAAYCDNQAFTGVVFPLGVTRPAVPYAFPAVKAPNTYRIFVLGESAAYGDPDPAYSFSRFLEVMLHERFPERRFEVINTSITAINSHALLRMAKELSNYQPDLFIVYAGNNEVIGPFGPGTTLTAQVPRLAMIRATMAGRATRIGQLLIKLTQKPRPFRGMEMFLDQQVPADSPNLPRAYEYLQANLSGIVSAAHQARANVILSTVATNLRDSAPFHSQHRSDLSTDKRARWDSAFASGNAKAGSGDCQRALQDYRNAEVLDGSYAELQFRIASCLARIGDLGHARLQFLRAEELDTLRFRAEAHINDAIRQVANEHRDSTSLVDTAVILASASSDGVPGRELFYDHVHLRPQGNYLVASALFRQIVSSLQRNPGSDRSDQEVLSEAECDRRLALTDFDITRIAQQMQRRLQRPPFTGQLGNAEQIARYREEEREHTVSLDASLSAYQSALAYRSNDYLLRQNLGLLLYGIDRPSAVAQLRLSRPYHDLPLYMPDGTRIE